MSIPDTKDEKVESEKELSIDSEEKSKVIETNSNSEEMNNTDSVKEEDSKEKVVFNYYNFEKDNKNTKRTEILNAIEKFGDGRVYVTKKVRMSSETRLNKNNIHSIVLVNVYTFTTLCFSIFNITNETDPNIELLGLIVSIGLFGVSLFVSLFGYREKAIAFKNSYLKITEIEGELSTLLLNNELTESELIEAYSLCQKKYNEILDKTDNHIDKDFIAYKYSSKDVTINEILKHIYYKLTSSFIWILLYSIPLITMYLIISALFEVN